MGELAVRARSATGDRALRVTATSSSRRVLVLEFVRRYFRDFGQSPSVPEIAAELRTDKHSVYRLLRTAAAQGEIDWTPGVARSIRLPDRTGQLADSEVLAELRRRGWTIVTDSPLPA